MWSKSSIERNKTAYTKFLRHLNPHSTKISERPIFEKLEPGRRGSSIWIVFTQKNDKNMQNILQNKKEVTYSVIL